MLGALYIFVPLWAIPNERLEATIPRFHVDSSRIVSMICGVTIFEMPRCTEKQQVNSSTSTSVKRTRNLESS